MSKLNSPKNILRVTRDRVLRFSEISEMLSQLETRVEELKKSQLELATSQRLFYENLKKEISNSGFIQLSKSEIMTKIFSGAKMYLDPRDVGLVPHLILDGEWEGNITKAWLSIARPDDVILDIGANFGYFGVLAAQQTNRNCKIILFEANPQLIPYISKTMMVNSFSECAVVENLAVSDKQGKLKLNVLKDYIASSSIHSVEQLNQYNKNGATLELESVVEIVATTIDSYCKQHDIKELNLIKMDIEGYEDKAYAGMRQMIQKSSKVTMFIEFTKQSYENPKQFYEQMLKDFGNVYIIEDDGSISRPKQTDYDSIIGNSEAWVMPVFSKRNDIVKI